MQPDKVIDISVIIATRNGLKSLRKTLEALAAQELGDVGAELVVIDNGSTDCTTQYLRERSAHFPWPMTIGTEEMPGVSAARNTAVERARGELILSLNDDTTPARRDLVAGHVAAHRAEERPVAVLGRITYPASDLAASPFMAWTNDGPQFDYAYLDAGAPPSPAHYFTAHLSVARSQFLEVGGMDQRFVFGYEDAAFGKRLADAGVPLRYRPELMAVHYHPITPQEWRVRTVRMGAAGALVNRLYPTIPPLAASACNWKWRAAVAADAILGRVPGDWSWAPTVLRSLVYETIHRGSYARGYLRASGTTAAAPQDTRPE